MGVLVDIIGFLGIIYLWVIFLESGTGYPFSSFPSESCINLFLGGGNGFHSFFFFPSFLLVSCNHSCWYHVTILDRLVGGFSHLFSFPWLNFVL
jgi:hypothetical protein